MAYLSLEFPEPKSKAGEINVPVAAVGTTLILLSPVVASVSVVSVAMLASIQLDSAIQH